MVYITTTKRLALRCDLPWCKATFHPRWVASTATTLRELAWNQGWNILSRERDYCCSRHAALATGQPVDPPENRRSDPICGEDTCAACEQTTCRPNTEDEDFAAEASENAVENMAWSVLEDDRDEAREKSKEGGSR